MKEDRFLLGILGAIGLLVVAAIALFARGVPGYVEDGTPTATVQNFVIALEQRDYERAYGYLADEPGKPAFGDFRQFTSSGRMGNSNAGLVILSSETVNGKTFVDMEIIHTGSGLFDSGWREPGTAELVEDGTGWKLTRMPYSFWGYDWYGDALQIEPPPSPGE